MEDCGRVSCLFGGLVDRVDEGVGLGGRTWELGVSDTEVKGE